jgi:glutamate racemase
LPEQVTIIDSGQAVARQTKHLLMQNQLSSKMKDTGSVQMLTNGDPEVLKQLASNKYDVKVEDF